MNVLNGLPTDPWHSSLKNPATSGMMAKTLPVLQKSVKILIDARWGVTNVGKSSVVLNRYGNRMRNTTASRHSG